MGIPSELRDMWVSRRESFLIASPAEERKIVRTKKCTNEGVRAGFKAASIACVASAVPTLAAVRMVPWAKANLNYVAQALIISAVWHLYLVWLVNSLHCCILYHRGQNNLGVRKKKCST